MRNKMITVFCCLIAGVFTFLSLGSAQESAAIKLPAPQMTGGKPLMQALKERKTSREFSAQELPMQVLSDMLWAADGINRPDADLRTAPTAMNLQEIDIYVVMQSGVFLYDAKDNMLKPVLAGDLRALTGKQEFCAVAPINLVFVADYGKMGKMPQADASFYAATDTGNISQNVYLFCASEGLATVVRGWMDKPALAQAMKLRADQAIILAQTVGYPQEQEKKQ
jgi:SagB-type dehydrogenase family enzyme